MASWIATSIVALSGCGLIDASLNEGSTSSPNIDFKLEVTATYASNSKWNDYVRYATPSLGPFEQAETSCDGTETGPGINCIHAGEMKSVVISHSQISDCSDITLTDELGVFDWTCRSSLGSLIFSSTLKNKKGLRDLVTKNGWKQNKVTLKNAIDEIIGQSDPSSWWSNVVEPITDNSSSSPLELNSAGKIYTLDISNSTRGYSMMAEKMSIVSLNSSVLSNALTGNNFNSTDGSTTSPDRKMIVAASGQKFLWIELDIDGQGGSAANESIYLRGTVYSRLNNIHIKNSSGTHIGVYTDSNYNLITGSRLSYNSTAVCLYMSSVSFNRVIDTNISNCMWGVYFNAAADNVLYNYNTSQSTTDNLGFNSSGSNDNNLVRGLSANSANNGVGFINSPIVGSTLLSTLIINNIDGVWFSAGSNVDKSTFTDLATYHNSGGGSGYGIRMSGAQNTKLTGQFYVGSNNDDCVIAGGSTGIIDSTCALQAPSTATLARGDSLTSSFMGKVTGDSANTSHSSGVATYSVNLDFFNFDSLFRNFGVIGSSFPNQDQTGPCSSGICQIWDWTLSNSDSVLRHVNGTLSKDCPSSVNGDNASFDQQTPSNTYLNAATEIMQDYIGDDDGLCENDEHCLFSPNIGSYQGHGSLSECTFTSGTVSGVRMFGYTSNGY